jgi:sporulation-control protein spo0M
VSERAADLYAVALEISKRRRGILALLREALERDDVLAIKKYARQLVGLDDAEEAERPKRAKKGGKG